MARVFSLFSFIIILSFIFCKDVISQNQLKYPEQLKQLHQNVWANILETPVDEEEVAVLMSFLTAKGSWEDIDYTSQQRGAWEPRSHISRLLKMATAYQTEGSRLFQNKELSQKIHSGLNFWFKNDFICPNWWYPEIGVPIVLAPLMILMEVELSAAQKQMGIQILDRAEIGMTGQNKVWLSGNVLMRALLLKDTKTIKKAAESIKEELVVSTGEGVQPDWSYHQHGPQLQFGNYGLSYINDMIKWISVLRKTSFQFDENKIEILRNYLLNGQQWVTWKNQMDISACGRQLFIDSPEQKAASLSSCFSKMESLDPANAEKYQKANDYKMLSGNKHFWRSDFQVQRTPGSYFSVKMCSERVIGAESCNSENLQGYYMGDGATFLYQNGEEYRNIFPFLDWKKIPGVTAHQDKDTLPVLTARGYRLESNFVGGVSDGRDGIAAMDYKRNGLTAKKSWFMFDDLVVCLGAGITSSMDLPVTTGVNQVYYNGEIESATKPGSDEIYKWILHEKSGYYFPEGSNVKLTAKTEKGSWNWVASRYPPKTTYAKIFRLWLEHGVNPQNETYQYLLVPNATVAKMKTLDADFPFKVHNKKNLQEVVSKDEKIAGIVFHEAGKSELMGGIEVDEPCLVMLKKQVDEIRLFVAEPTQLLNEITLTLNGKFLGENTVQENGRTKIKIDLPKNEEAGKTMNLILKIR
ncbi:polysaccharide lyase 8 family protein [Maribellus maritimus]|uniref:polysaccharide lyase 8 family protein n=1 Tax=Maribellus maritimus TaxID=2870838 RepID=UPI001EE9BAB6|nr:polysaccharide lyase 8 family protein [Maribellus maritimus]MCG6189734.1 polysaccharide lyase 8 family protein [Maribellus maritimus]